MSNAGGLWLLKGDTSEERKQVGSIDEQAEITPSAYWKLVCVAKWCKDERDPGTFLVVVRVVNVEEVSTSSQIDLYLGTQALMAEYPRVFKEAEGVEKDPSVRHAICLEDDAKPSHVKLCRFMETQHNEMKEQVALLIQKGWVRPSASPWGALVLLVPKKDGTWRFCVDFHILNAVTVRDSFPLPCIDDLLHKVGQAKVFSKMDLQSGFY